MKKITTLSCILFFTVSFQAQTSTQVWKSINEKEIRLTGKRDIIPNSYKTYHVDLNKLQNILATAPLDNQVSAENSNIIVNLPMPNGEIQKFKVVESPVMEESLQMSFPSIRTYNVRGIDDIYATGKLDVTEYGFHGMIRSPKGDIFIDPYCTWNTEDYISYYTYNFEKPEEFRVPCQGAIGNNNTTSTEKISGTAAMICAGTELRTYRLAVACTGEYARAACQTGTNTPTTAQILSKVVTSVNRVDGVYETEVAVKLVLVPTTTLVLFGDPTTDPFNGNSNASTLINESQSVIDSNVGSANYDIGHTFSTGGGGLAMLGCVCSSIKARGITGSGNPVGDPYDIDYVAHEMGHQFSGNHTFRAASSSCSGNGNYGGGGWPSTAVEPGSGITIMAYAGICGSTNDLASHSIAYFHAVSYDEIMDFTTNGGGSSCAITSTTGNTPPSVNVMGNLTTAPNTPFTLTGSATDPDGDSLTYQWEEVDAASSSGNWNAGTKPFFMSYAPTISSTRSCPNASVIASGNLQGTKGEYLPTTAQVLKFRLTARDNKMGGGGVCSATTQVTIVNFSVTSQNTAGIVYQSGSTQSITWNVNGTDTAPINCANVNIYVSTNAGVSYSLVLSNTPNDGSENITLPTVATTIGTCRVKVSSSNNVFYDANDFNFTISTSTGINQYANAEGLKLSLYPNPFTSTVKIDINAGNNLNLDKTVLNVYDVLGNLVRTEKIKLTENYTETFDFSSLANGSYLVVVTDGTKKSVAKLIKL